MKPSPGDSPGIEEKVRKALASVDPNLVLYGTDSYDKVVRGDFQQEGMIATLTTLFGVLGLVLSAVGLYGVMAYMVEQRTGEIGVRMALGADRGRVLRMVLTSAFSQVAIGLAIGIPAAIGAGKLMTQQSFSVRPWDPVMLALATLALGLAALLAAALPAWRAAGVEPMVALRNESTSLLSSDLRHDMSTILWRKHQESETQPNLPTIKRLEDKGTAYLSRTFGE